MSLMRQKGWLRRLRREDDMFKAHLASIKFRASLGNVGSPWLKIKMQKSYSDMSNPQETMCSDPSAKEKRKNRNYEHDIHSNII